MVYPLTNQIMWGTMQTTDPKKTVAFLTQNNCRTERNIMNNQSNLEHNQVLAIARKWYAKIPFPKEFDAEFEQLLEQQKDLKCMPFAAYDLEQNRTAFGKNLVMFLYFCEELSQRYAAAGISDDILLGTLEDFVVSAQRNRVLRGSIGVVTAYVLVNHLSMRLFRIGRLQFCIDDAPMDIPAKGIKAGDPVIDVHIPPAGPLSLPDCMESLALAEQFFKKYFPEYKYDYYTCYSWLLDEGLQRFLKADSNILQFQKLFEVVHKQEQDSILHFMFKYGIGSREELQECAAKTDFARQVKEYALSGGVFYNVLGLLPRSNLAKEIE